MRLDQVVSQLLNDECSFIINLGATVKRYSTVFLIPLFSAPSLWAQSSSVTNTSSTDLSYQLGRFVERLEMNYKNLSAFSTQGEDESEYEGKIDYDEAPTGRMLNELEVGYRLNKDTIASIVGVWSFQPQADRSEETQVFEVLDPYAKFTFEGVIEKGNFELSSDLRIGAPVARESREAQKVVSFGTEQEIEYQFGKTPWSFELELFFQYNVQNTSENHNDLDVRYEPAFMYAFTDKIYGRLGYESQMRHERHEKLMLVDNREPAAQVGLGWLASRKLEIYPFVDVNLTEPGTKTALYGALVAWNIL